MKLVTVPGNGFCFISCVLVTLAEQGINKSLDVLSVEIMIEITNHLAHYKQYGNKKDMTMFLVKCADYFQKGIYDSDAVDICIGATANALGINVHVLQKSNDKKRVHMSSFLCLHSLSTDIYLHHYPGKLKGKNIKKEDHWCLQLLTAAMTLALNKLRVIKDIHARPVSHATSTVTQAQ